jgi:uncharacterized protein (DUF433 family)
MQPETPSQIEVAPGIVRRSDRGLCIAGKRIALYLVMDYLKAGWPPHLIRHWLDLSEEEITNSINFIESTREDFEAEYDEVVRNASEREQFWRERNRQRRIDASKRHFTPKQAAAWARLMSLKRTEMIS